MHKILLFSFLYFLTGGVVFADCPAINTITQNPNHPNSWQAPWYEGFSEWTPKGVRVTTFDHACWFNNTRSKLLPPQGVSFCYYNLENNKQVWFGQNDWDIHIPRPEGKQWTPLIGTQSCDLICYGSIENCSFKGYPPPSVNEVPGQNSQPTRPVTP